MNNIPPQVHLCHRRVDFDNLGPGELPETGQPPSRGFAPLKIGYFFVARPRVILKGVRLFEVIQLFATKQNLNFKKAIPNYIL